ncbi:MAG: His/Gly/Thr/Pro-type tRNA ligase C-terminal domain-containing protein, partial [Firmicutes bacterium]|nr:His/Gly/Thr/Pro-type tRNA ligase C-terminal domain-containing protein [Bacillota bacterium]
MDITFTNKEGKNEYCWMGTYGFGVGRVLNIALEHNCDDDGLVFPLAVAPYSIGIVSLCEDEQYKKAQNVYDYFNSNNVDVVWDDRDLSLGVKIKDMLLHGIPYIVVIGKNSKGDLLEVENRKTREKSFINKQALLKIIKQ